jgi:radical SAM protein with 4Fe4S-binding SPASM domain
MYVQPFWSYSGDAGAITVTNHISGECLVAEPHFIDMMETIFAGSVDESPAVEAALRVHLVFADRTEAWRWMDAQTSAERRVFPVIDQIELTNRCPYTCVMCPRTSSMRRELGDMSREMFEKILSEMAGRQNYVGLHHFGESLLHRDLPEFIAVAREVGVLAGLSCNPPSLKPHLAEHILKAGLANMLLSLDSLDDDRYRQIRGQAANFARADRYLRALVGLRDAMGAPTALTLQMIQMHNNSEEAERFLDYCADIGVDRGVVIRLGRWDFDDAKVAELGEWSTPLHDGYCGKPISSVVVLWDGRVVPCCHDYDGSVVLGDLSKQSLDEIWCSKAAQRFQARSDDTELCRKCAAGRWFREARRSEIGFQRFHRAVAPERSYEWLNPRSDRRVKGMSLFNEFDVAPAG